MKYLLIALLVFTGCKEKKWEPNRPVHDSLITKYPNYDTGQYRTSANGDTLINIQIRERSDYSKGDWRGTGQYEIFKANGKVYLYGDTTAAIERLYKEAVEKPLNRD